MLVNAIAFDLDDTLLRDDRSISPYTIRVLRQAAARGIHIIPASGRAKGSMRGFVEQMACASCYISCNGAEVWDAKTHELLSQELLPIPLALEAAAFAEANNCYVQTYYGAKFYYSQQGKYAKAYAESSMLTGEYVGNLTSFIDRPTAKILLMDTPETIARLLGEAQAQFAGRASVVCSKPYFLEINPLRATKGLALKKCGERLGFALENAVAFGDSLNDLSMLESAGLGVSMGNAWADVKARIPTTCLTNEEDGVADYIEHHILSH